MCPTAGYLGSISGDGPKPAFSRHQERQILPLHGRVSRAASAPRPNGTEIPLGVALLHVEQVHHLGQQIIEPARSPRDLGLDVASDHSVRSIPHSWVRGSLLVIEDRRPGRLVSQVLPWIVTGGVQVLRAGTAPPAAGPGGGSSRPGDGRGGRGGGKAQVGSVSSSESHPDGGEKSWFDRACWSAVKELPLYA